MSKNQISYEIDNQVNKIYFARDIENYLIRDLDILNSDKKMAITMTHRYDQDKTTLINELSSGKYGKIDYLICNVTADTRKLGSWGDFRHKMKNPLMIEGAVHHFDLLSTIAGSPCNTLYAQTWNPSWGDYNGDSQGLAILKFKNVIRVIRKEGTVEACNRCGWL